MKVLFITNILAPYRLSCFQRLSEQSQINLYIRLLSKCEKKRDWELNLPPNIDIKILPDFGFDFSHRWEWAIYHINPTVALEILKGGFDAVIIDGWDSFAGQISPILCKASGIPYIVWVESTLEQPSLRRKLVKPMIRLIVKNSAALVVPGSKARDYVTSLGAQRERVFIAPNSVDNEIFKTESEKHRRHKEELKCNLKIDSELIILYIGRLIKGKGIHFLIQAFSLIKKEFENVGLVIVGEGGYKQELLNQCEDSNIKDVYFTGSIPYDQLSRYYAISDIFVLPTIEEVWGMVLNEAMACGLPVITTKVVGAIPGLVTDGVEGLVIDEGDSYQLYQAIKNMLQNKDMMIRMGQNAQRKVLQQFTPEATAQGFIEGIEYAKKVKHPDQV